MGQLFSSTRRTGARPGFVGVGRANNAVGLREADNRKQRLVGPNAGALRRVNNDIARKAYEDMQSRNVAELLHSTSIANGGGHTIFRYSYPANGPGRRRLDRILTDLQHLETDLVKAQRVTDGRYRNIKVSKLLHARGPNAAPTLPRSIFAPSAGDPPEIKALKRQLNEEVRHMIPANATNREEILKTLRDTLAAEQLVQYLHAKLSASKAKRRK